MESAEVRRRFLGFFERNGHTVVPSAPLVHDDPNLLFVNAGMVPFKPYFLGQQTPPFPRATSVQKCVRTLDIEEVGRTTRHGSFFQMNGNFSFGDYFKERAIELAWEFVTASPADGGIGFDESRLWVTVFRDDDETVALWKRIAGIADDRIVRRGMADNFWSMGVPGPCGPCTEIYIDRGPQYGPDGGPEVDEDRFLEFWNLVFMQFERGEGPGKEGYPILGELPAKNIDTGMGLERVAYLLQGVDNLYEIDEVMPVLRRASELSGRPYRQPGGSREDDVRMRVVADHVRTALMLIGDGVTPGNEGRGYVLRRMLRRAVRSMLLLGVDAPVIPELLAVSRDCMSASYPELSRDWDRILQVASVEEQVFRQTLRAGTQIFDLAATQTQASGSTVLPGERAFTLHDTYGFPIDLTLEMAAERGLTVDQDGFRALMTDQRERAKADAKAKKTGHADLSVYRDALDRHGPTDWLAYTALSTESSVLALLDGPAGIPAAAAGTLARVILDRTPFYAESGGQHADAGTLTWDGGRAEVLDVQRPIKGLVVHQVRVLDGELTTGAPVHAEVDRDWRLGACQAHSGTHVVHAALRQVLGPSALQSGSFNRPGYLRLDFAWPAPLDPQQRADVERVANEALRQDLPVSARNMTLPEAESLGALALFGETYGELVRVVEIGGPWSRELCGGTHVSRSSQIGIVVVTGDSSVGSSTRRVEAVVGLEGQAYLARERDLVSQLSELLKSPREDLAQRVASVLDRLRSAEKEVERLRAREVLAQAADLARDARDLAGTAYVAARVPEGTTAEDMRRLVLDVRGRLPGERPGVVVAAGVNQGRPSVVVTVNEAGRAAGLRAGELVRRAASALGGGGGGKDDIAQGGGTDPGAVEAALAEVERAVAAAGPGFPQQDVGSYLGG